MSSTGFIRVPPPLSLRRGGAAPGSILVVGGAGGHTKLKPATKLIRKGFPTIWDWLEETANWLELSPCTPDQWINTAGIRLEKGANSWFKVEEPNIHSGNSAPWPDW